MADQQPTQDRQLSRLIRLAWFVVLCMMLAAAAWSITGKLTAWGMDHRLAAGLSLMFDLAGLICAEYARRAIERGTPAGLPRLAILAFVSVSGVLNWSHGREIGGTVAGLGLASISFAVELLFELHRRDVRDEQRAERGLVAERMPHIPLLAWVMFPRRAWTTLRGAIGARLDVLDPVQAAPTVVVERAPIVPPVAPPATPQQPPAPQLPAAAAVPPAVVYRDPRCAAIRPLYDNGTRPGTAAMRDALIAAGHGRVGDSTIRGVLRAEVEEHEKHLAQLPPALPMASGQNP
ncbi:DUF2637 domain-containing protein [Streptomyces phaeochromogenes]|uniref:DUF2637 domain-containing protein n=1 Tax=Streptomyces phaeochromogenes TaxID=1923 RepID=UPI002DDA33A7|nr:DUF2637 domain-containing protein [Streptomyces phaeochromogenes]WRZ32223.1 DUF2637 domain-containing protein [Streptomyces phaeochromogenes]